MMVGVFGKFMNSVEIKELRKALELDQVELAAMVKVRQKTISLWESGKKRPSRAMLGRLDVLRELVEGYPDGGSA
jgi:DNA-binding transcriptional regulator YiaG